MSWAKRNLYFLISAVVAVALLGAAGWYCYTSWQANNANWEQLNGAYSQLESISGKNPGAGNNTVNNIETARTETKDVRERIATARKFFRPVPSIPNTNHFDDRMMAFAVRETIARLRSSAAQHNVLLPVDFAFSFSLQQQKVVYDPKSWDQLSKQMGEIKAICDVLYNARVASLDSVQRERTADDINTMQGGGGGQPDYVDSISVTNNNNIVVTPYEVTFRCFTPELGAVLSGFANLPHTIVVKTMTIQPEELTSAGEGMPGMMGGAYGNQRPIAAAGGLPVVIDEKKLKVTLLLDFVKMLPEGGR
ncbi:MAG TPA: Amuc_1100 family pilus-like protein [Verrucomicrobiae bacterium]|jgi:hypothetical protein|nr:Amuc_1100 family pilus-like protein [Verrucomicrobiae bacterium]